MEHVYAVGVGGANIDLCGRSYAPIEPRDSNPGEIEISAGGVTRNICDNLARLGADVKLVSAVGDDLFAHRSLSAVLIHLGKGQLQYQDDL